MFISEWSTERNKADGRRDVERDGVIDDGVIDDGVITSGDDSGGSSSVREVSRCSDEMIPSKLPLLSNAGLFISECEEKSIAKISHVYFL